MKHPFLWASQQKLFFLSEVSDYIETNSKLLNNNLLLDEYLILSNKFDEESKAYHVLD